MGWFKRTQLGKTLAALRCSEVGGGCCEKNQLGKTAEALRNHGRVGSNPGKGKKEKGK